jgi:hypothetical protein
VNWSDQARKVDQALLLLGDSLEPPISLLGTLMAARQLDEVFAWVVENRPPEGWRARRAR